MNPPSTRGLFLLFEGLPPTIIESQVLAHVRAMTEVGVQMEIWSFAVTPAAFRQAVQSLDGLRHAYGVPIRLFRGVRPALPASEIVNAALLWWHLRLATFLPAFIHARTDYSAAVAIRLKARLSLQVIWDARGDTLAEFRAKRSTWRSWKKLLAPIKERAIQRRLERVRRQADRACFVSAALKKLQGTGVESSRAWVTPCLADERLFFFSPALRQQTRLHLSYSPDDCVLVYVGSAAPWQCIPETIALIRQMLAASAHCRAVIITPDAPAFRELQATSRVSFVSASLSEVNEYLNAADYGILLRAPSPINWVASPVKFAEYSLAGLKIITTDAVEQVNLFGLKMGNTVRLQDISPATLAPLPIPARQALADKARALLSRGNAIESLRTLYSDCT